MARSNSSTLTKPRQKDDKAESAETLAPVVPITQGQAPAVTLSTTEQKALRAALVGFDKADKARDDARWILADAVYEIVTAHSGSKDAEKAVVAFVRTVTNRLGKDERTVSQEVSDLVRTRRLYPADKRFPHTSFEAHKATVGTLSRTENTADRETMRKELEAFRQKKESGKISVTEMRDLVDQLKKDGKLTDPESVKSTRGRNRSTSTNQVDTEASLVTAIHEAANKLQGLLTADGKAHLSDVKLQRKMVPVVKMLARMIPEDVRNGK